MPGGWVRLRLMTLCLLEVVVFHQIILLISDIIGFENQLRSKKNDNTGMAVYILTLISAANLCISGLYVCGGVFLPEKAPVCGGVRLFKSLIKWWTLWKVVFAILVLLLADTNTGVPQMGAQSFLGLLIAFLGYECFHWIIQFKLFEELADGVAEPDRKDILFVALSQESEMDGV